MKYEQYPSRSAKRNYFPLPNEIFSLGLSTGEIATYAYLMRCEDRETYQCYPSYETIGEAIGKTKNLLPCDRHHAEAGGGEDRPSDRQN